MTVNLSGRRALVTGGSRGIGLAVVQELCGAGAEVRFTARNQSAIDEALLAMEPDATVSGMACDVTDDSVMAELFRDPFDILVNNAGAIEPIGRIADIDVDEWGRNHEVNVLGAFRAIKFALPGMMSAGGTVVNLSSGAAFQPMEGWSAYCSGKAALAMVSRCVHLEYGDHGIRSFGFAPGLVDTDMQGTIRKSGINSVSEIPKVKLRPASEPARAIVWLCTEAAADLSGQDVDVRDEAFRKRCGLEPLA